MSDIGLDEWDMTVVVYSGQRAGKTLELKRRALALKHARNLHAAHGSLSGCTLPRAPDPGAAARICAFVGLPPPPAQTWPIAYGEVCRRCTLDVDVCSCHTRGES